VHSNQHFKRLLSRLHDLYLVTLGFEVEAQSVGKVPFVFHNQNPAHLTTGSSNTKVLPWGGWYDHEPPVILAKPQGDYQYGFRVPLLVVSAYTPAGYINNVRHDFGSILRFIEFNFGITQGALNFADALPAI
jgi:hypothetical protein